MDKRFARPIIYGVMVYVLIQAIGLWISMEGPGGSAGIIDAVKSEEIPSVVEEAEDPASSLQIFGYVIVSTAIILLLMKYRLGSLIKVFVFIGLFGGLSITLWGLLGGYGLVVALPIYLFAVWKREDFLVMNLLLILVIPGIGSWLGASLSFVPTLILLIGLAVYDLVAVFGTKHMVKLAEGSKDVPLMFSIPVEERVMGLGTGDLAIPMVFTVSVLRDYSLSSAIAASLGGLLGLVALFMYIFGKKDVVLPALPPIAIGLIGGFVAGMLLA